MTGMKPTLTPEMEAQIERNLRHLTHVCGVCGAQTDNAMTHVDMEGGLETESLCIECATWCVIYTMGINAAKEFN